MFETKETVKSTSLVVLSVFEDQELRDPTISGGGVVGRAENYYYYFFKKLIGSEGKSGHRKLFILLLENRIWAPEQGQPNSDAWTSN